MARADEQFGRDWLKQSFHLSDRDLEAFHHFEALLLKWQKVQNLVSRETLETIWTRHFCDSARLLRHSHVDDVFLDFGSGAGFPGLVIGIMISLGKGTGHVTLVESNGRKVAFLRTVARELELPVQVISGRVESVTEQFSDNAPSIITARAVADLDQLLAYSHPLLSARSKCLFHKGRDIDSEVVAASNNWTFDLLKHHEALLFQGDQPSSDGVVVEISNVQKIL